MDFYRWCGVIIGIFSGFTLSGCKVGPDFHSPPPPAVNAYTKFPLPKKTIAVAAAGNVGKAQYLDFGQNIPAQWWRLFHSAALNQLIKMGVINNPSLVAAQATLRQAQQVLRATIGNLLFPSVDLQLLAERTRTSGLAAASQGSGVSGSASSASSIFNVYYTAVSVSYMLDLFGGARRQVEASRAQMDYERYQYLGTYLSLTANIATTAITSAELIAEIQATQALIREEKKLLRIMQQQLQLGGISLENVVTQQTQLAQTEALLPPLQVQLSQSQHALAVLIGEFPSQRQLPPLFLATLHLPTHLPISLPANLVRQRPDVQAAEALLHEASANIGVATANLLPQITLNANYGYASTALNTLFMPANIVWSVAGQLLQPIFHAGALIAERRAAVAAYQSAFAQYRQVVLQAFQNVADALRALEIDAYEFKAQKQAENFAFKNLQIMQGRFQLGGQNYLNVLVAEQQYQQTKINRIKAQAQRYNDTAALFQALGGGWWHG